MKHCIATRFKFDEDDFDLMQHYINVAKITLIPNLVAQLNQNFDWLVYTNPKHDEWVKENLTGYPYRIIHDLNGELSAYNIQTRHDIDDWMHPAYVKSIQEVCETTEYEKCLIHVNLIVAQFETKETMILPVWHSRKTSQFLTMYQKEKNKDLYVYMCQHTDVWQHVPDVIELPLGMTMQVKHGKNISK